MKPLPEEFREPAEKIIKKYEGNGWSDIRIGLPDESTAEKPLIWMWATNKKGERTSVRFDQTHVTFELIESFLSSS